MTCIAGDRGHGDGCLCDAACSEGRRTDRFRYAQSVILRHVHHIEVQGGSFCFGAACARDGDNVLPRRYSSHGRDRQRQSGVRYRGGRTDEAQREIAGDPTGRRHGTDKCNRSGETIGCAERDTGASLAARGYAGLRRECGRTKGKVLGSRSWSMSRHEQRYETSEGDGADEVPAFQHGRMGTHYLRFLQRRKRCPSGQERILTYGIVQKQYYLSLVAKCVR